VSKTRFKSFENALALWALRTQKVTYFFSAKNSITIILRMSDKEMFFQNFIKILSRTKSIAVSLILKS